MSPSRSVPKHLPHRVAFFLIAALLFGIIALLPFVLEDVVLDVSESANPTYAILGDYAKVADTRTHLNLNVTDLDEWHRKLTIQVSGHHVCPNSCTWTDRLLFVSVPIPREDGEGLPPFTTVDFGPSALAVTKEVTLPVSGHAIRYPFDRYGLELGVVLQRVFPDGTVQALTPDEADGQIFISVNGSIPRVVMQRPVAVDIRRVFVDNPAYGYVSVSQLTFVRPVYLRVLSILLVLLVSAAAAYAIFMRPLTELVINAGALVLGIWGIRAILLGANVPGFTVIDLSLMIVTLALLAAITWRASAYLYQKGEMAHTLRVRRRSRNNGAAAKASEQGQGGPDPGEPAAARDPAAVADEGQP